MKLRRTLLILVILAIAGVLVWANRHENPLPPDLKADLVVVEKSKRQLLLYSQGSLLKTYAISQKPMQSH